MTLAFNTIGWQSQNVLFNAIDALLGSPTLASAFGGENPSDATATMLDTVVNASGQLTVSALDQRDHHLQHHQHEQGQLDGPHGGQRYRRRGRALDEQGEQCRGRQYQLRQQFHTPRDRR